MHSPGIKTSMYFTISDEDDNKNTSTTQPVAVANCDVVVVDSAEVVFTILASANKQEKQTSQLQIM